MRVRSASPYVDYEQAAGRYRQGRALPAEVLHRWGRAVHPHLPPVPGRAVRVADVGAGTGIFAAAWHQWPAEPAEVVAVEPAAAMIRAGDPAVRYVRGAAEQLPLRAGSVDVVWVSTALHHFADQARAVREFGRVLAEAGRVMVRTYLPGRSEITWLRVFPGVPKAMARVPALSQLVALFGSGGFRLRHVTEVPEELSRFADAADWVERMRHADSLLTALTDQEVADGLRVLRATPAEPARVELSLVVFDRRVGGS